MATHNLPTPENLRNLLTYEPDTGELYWKKRTKDYFKCQRDCDAWNNRNAGKKAGTRRSNDGYEHISVNGKYILSHRVAWAIYYGAWPAEHIDHINGDGADNRVSNLRNVSRGLNMRNSKMKNNNTTGFTGIFWIKRINKWRAEIQVDRNRISLGYFDEIKAAIAARRAAENKYGFTQRHGRSKHSTSPRACEGGRHER